MDIKAYMVQDHHDCDTAFAQMEEVANEKGLADAKEVFDTFVNDTERHFQMEERVLFPMFEQKTGMTQGPTVVMRHEHEQLRALMSQMAQAQIGDDKDKFFGLSETFMIMIQQHNMKEEQMLYTMIQQHLGAQNDDVIAMMQSMIVQ